MTAIEAGSAQLSFQRLLQHGYTTLFVASFAERLGVPLLVTPLVVTAGLVAASGQLDLLAVVAVITFAAILGDWLWFELGQRRGGTVVNFLCRISLSRDSCVRRTQMLASRHAGASLLYSKWIPGVSHLSPPIAGMSGMTVVRFTVLNSIGTFAWVVILVLAGWISTRPLEWTSSSAALFAVLPLWLLAILVGNVVWKYVQRYRFIRSLRLARIAPSELFARIQDPEDDRPMIIDLRHPLDVLHDPRTIPGALNILPEEIEQYAKDLALAREVVLVCT
jgi:membrane protein DedA with SNARE-associated domain